MRATFKQMSRTARVTDAVLAVVSASVVSSLLSDQPLLFQMFASLITAVVVEMLAILLFGAKRNQRPHQDERPPKDVGRS